MAYRPRNVCRECSYGWFPRGRDVSRRCLNCGSGSVQVDPTQMIVALVLGGVIAVFALLVVIAGATSRPNPTAPEPPSDRTAKTEPRPAVHQEPSRIAAGDPVGKTDPAPAPDPRKAEALAKAEREYAATWTASQEERAVAVSQRIGDLEARLVEREATYKRRVEAGLLDGATKKEIEQLKKDIDNAIHDLHLIEQALAAGPPPYIPPTDLQDSGEPQASGVRPSPLPSGSSAGKTVQVRGYTRKDGTVVAPYTRSVPRK